MDKICQNDCRVFVFLDPFMIESGSNLINLLYITGSLRVPVTAPAQRSSNL